MNMKISILYLIDTENTNWCCTVRAKDLLTKVK